MNKDNKIRMMEYTCDECGDTVITNGGLLSRFTGRPPCKVCGGYFESTDMVFSEKEKITYPCGDPDHLYKHNMRSSCRDVTKMKGYYDMFNVPDHVKEKFKLKREKLEKKQQDGFDSRMLQEERTLFNSTQIKRFCIENKMSFGEVRNACMKIIHETPPKYDWYF